MEENEKIIQVEELSNDDIAPGNESEVTKDISYEDSNINPEFENVNEESSANTEPEIINEELSADINPEKTNEEPSIEVESGTANDKPEDTAEKETEENDTEENDTNEILEESEKNEENKKKINKKTIKLISVIAAIILVIIIASSIISANKIVSISAEYNGKTEAGTVLDATNEGFQISGKQKNGASKEITGWTIDDPVTLEADESSTVTVSYKGLTDKVQVDCSTLIPAKIIPIYTGNTEAGTVINNNSPGLDVKVENKKGKVISGITAKDCTVDEVTLEANKATTVKITYKDLEAELEIKCSTITVDKITATYDGDTEAGTVLGRNNKGIHVTAEYGNGTTDTVSGWKVVDAKKLKAGAETTVVIEYEGQTCELTVQCSTMSASQYKAQCKEMSYETIAREGNSRIGEYVKFTGEVMQVIKGSNGKAALMVQVTYNGYYYEDNLMVMYYTSDISQKFLEDDIITFYGTVNGDYSYETVLGAEKTIPSVWANYIDLN